MSIIKPVIQKLFSRVATRVHKHDLFEQPNERPPQAALNPDMETKETEASPDQAVSDSLIDIPELGNTLFVSSGQILERLKHIDHPIVINHWATWCDPCREEMPVLVKLIEKLGDVVLIGVCWELFEDGWLAHDVVSQRIALMSQDHGIEWGNWVLRDDPDTFFETFEMTERKIPQTWVIHPAGKERWVHHGVLEESDIESILNQL